MERYQRCGKDGWTDGERGWSRKLDGWRDMEQGGRKGWMEGTVINRHVEEIGWKEGWMDVKILSRPVEETG